MCLRQMIHNFKIGGILKCNYNANPPYKSKRPLTRVNIHFGHVRMYATPYPISWIIYLY